MTAPAADPERVGLVAGAKLAGISAPSLRKLVEDGSVRHRSRRPHGRGTTYGLDRDELRADIDRLPRCLSPGCGRPAPGTSGYCGEHFGHGGRRAARKHEADELGTDRTWLTRGETIQGTGWAGGTIDRLIKDGELEAERVGRHVRIARASLDRLLDSGWTPPRGRQPGTGTDAALPVRRAEAARRYRAGVSLKEIASGMGVGATTVRRWLGVEGVEMRSGGPRSRYPDLGERGCERCGTTFKPRAPSLDYRGGQQRKRRYCSDGCARAARPIGEAAAAAVHARGLKTVAEARAFLRVGSDRYVHELIRGGQIASERIDYPGSMKPVVGVRDDDLRSWRKEYAHRSRGDGRSRIVLEERWLDTGSGQRHVRRLARDEHGGDHGSARAEAKGRVAQRAGTVKAIRAGKAGGRPQDEGRNRRWLEMVLERRKWRDIESDYEAYWQVACDDIADHPEDWAGYLADIEERQRAIDRVRAAVKRLQTPRT